ncbi:FtsK/SpoIIIE domain-containing protein [Actinoplanes sp. NPDC026619]|uniref:FtsK/SpoIIIE domain-containing protein n=1 Tax=Actinoplanes sp. NPDC026619 TaxID=3155798 RepID=UPI0033F4668B
MNTVEERAVRLLIADEGGEVHAVEVRYSAQDRVGDLLVAFRRYARLPRQTADLTLVDHRSRACLPRDAPLGACQLLHGQRLSAVRAAAAPARVLPVLGGDDVLRLRTEAGAQIGLAWPLAQHHDAVLELDVDPDSGTVVRSDGSRSAVHLALDPDANCLIVTAPAERLLIDGAWPRGAAEKVATGSTLEILDDDGASVALLRVLTTHEHELGRLVEPVVGYRVAPPEHTTEMPKRTVLRLEAVPHGKVEPVDLAGTLLQQLPTFAMPLLFVVTIGFNAYLVIFFFLPFAYVAYQYYQKAKEKQKASRAVDEWRRQTDREIGVLQVAAKAEAAALRLAHPVTADLIALALNGREGLWLADSDPEKFLRVAIGRGGYRSPSTAELPGNRTDGDLQSWRAYIDKQRVVPDVPYPVDLTAGNLAVIGGGPRAAEAAAEILLRLSLTHSTNALAFAALLPSSGPDLSRLSWLKWLPHFDAPTDLFGGARFVHGKSDATDALRAAISDIGEGKGHLLLFVHEAADVEVRLIEALSERADGRLVVIWYGANAARVPDLVTRIVRVEPDATRGMLVAHISPEGRQVHLPQYDLDSVAEYAAGLACLVDETAAGMSSAIPAMVTLATIFALDPARLTDSIELLWAQSKVTEELSAAVGATATGTFEFDLCAQGPHALIGGTTGSGKSEFLRTLILSLICRYSPAELSLLLIDFKGGAALSDFRTVPHQVGVVSNLETSDVRRVIGFLREEINRRQRILRPFQGEYSRYRKAGAGDKRLPRLVVVIDEFAGFAGAGNDHTDAIINVAARGRSLGVHLVLATQRPGNGIHRDVSANVDARFCLRTLDDADSEAVIDTRDAAQIAKSLSGRAFARLSAGELEQFQTAWTGASSYGRRATRPELALDPFEPVALPPNGLELARPPDDRTDFGRLVDALTGCGTAAGYDVDRRLPDGEGVIWSLAADQPVLARALDKDLGPCGDFAAGATEIVLGRRDEPQHQRQSRETVDLARGGVLLTGGSLSGRTEFLCQIAGQFLRHPGHRVVVLDGGDGELARRLGAVAAYTSEHPTRDELDFLIEQLTSQGAQVGNDRVLVLIDRIEVLVRDRDAELVAPVIVNGPATQIYFAATFDHRVRIDPVLPRAFPYGYRAAGMGAGLAATEVEGVVRFYQAATPVAPRPDRGRLRRIGLPPGDLVPAHPAVPADSVFLGTNELHHELVAVALNRGLTVVGQDGTGRSATLLTLAEREAARLGREVPVLTGFPIEVPGLVDVIRAGLSLPELAERFWAADRRNYLFVDDAESRYDLFADAYGNVVAAEIEQVFRRWQVAVIAAGRVGLLEYSNNLPGVSLFEDRRLLVLQPGSGSQLPRTMIAADWERVVRPRQWRAYEAGEGVLVTCGAAADGRSPGSRSSRRAPTAGSSSGCPARRRTSRCSARSSSWPRPWPASAPSSRSDSGSTDGFSSARPPCCSAWPAAC